MKFSAVALFALGASAAAAPANMHKANKMDMEHMEHMDKMISRSTDMNEDMDHIANVKMEMGKAFLSNKEVESLGAMLRKLLGMHEEDAPEGHEGKGYTKRTAMHASFTLPTLLHTNNQIADFIVKTVPEIKGETEKLRKAVAEFLTAGSKIDLIEKLKAATANY